MNDRIDNDRLDRDAAGSSRILSEIQQRKISIMDDKRVALKRRWQRFIWIGIVVGGSLLLILTVWLLRTQIPESFTPKYVDSIDPSGVPVSAYRLYFIAPDGEGLSEEKIYLPRSGDFATDAETVLGALFTGSAGNAISPWPSETTVQEIFVSSAGVAYINFGASLKWLLPRGDLMEWAVIASLTRTLCSNFSEITGVRVLIDGESRGPLRELIPLDWEFRPSMFGETNR